ncbi:Uncharacterised protein r2_g157 [Pycnogonum litorale]
MLVYATGASQKYQCNLEELKRISENEKPNLKRKGHIDDLKNKKARIEEAIKDLGNQSDKWAEKAEFGYSRDILTKKHHRIVVAVTILNLIQGHSVLILPHIFIFDDWTLPTFLRASLSSSIIILVRRQCSV